MLGYLRSTSAFFLRPVELIRTYRSENLRADLIAGATVGVVLLPQGLAFSLLAGLPPEMGLYSAILATIIAGLWGSSHHLNTGPTNTASILTFATLLPIFTPGSEQFIAAAGVIAVLAGVFRLLMGVARLGLLVNFVSDSVAIGFTAGAGTLIVATQLSPILRVDNSTDPDLFGILRNLFNQFNSLHLPSLLLGIATIVIIVVLQRIARRFSPTLIGLIVIGVITWVLTLEQQGVRLLGELPQTLPPLAELPLFDTELLGELATGALAIATIGLVEASTIARALASNSGQRLDSNQEFVGQGLANIACGVFSGYPTSGSFNRSALALRSGGQTALTSVFSGLFVLAAMFAFGPLAANLPRTALAAAQIVAAASMIDFKQMRKIIRGERGEAAIMITTLLATLFLSLPFAVLTGVLMSLGYYIWQTSAPRVQEVLPDDEFRHWVQRPDRPSCPQLGVVDVLGDLYFGAVSHVEESIRQLMTKHPEQRFLILRMHSVLRCDISGIHALESIVRTYRARGGDVFMVRVREPVRQLMQATGFEKMLGADHLLAEEKVIDHVFYKVLDPAICIYECDVRAFRECQNLPKQLTSEVIPLRLSTKTINIPELPPREVWEQLRSEQPPLILDVREPREFEHGHVPGAQLMPLTNLAQHGDSLPRDRPIVTVCRGGRRSLRAAALLHERGFSNVATINGGMLAWRNADLLEAFGYDTSLPRPTRMP
jgi:SulP family sulfate permease